VPKAETNAFAKHSKKLLVTFANSEEDMSFIRLGKTVKETDYFAANGLRNQPLSPIIGGSY
jgi:hypothetical protein